MQLLPLGKKTEGVGWEADEHFSEYLYCLNFIPCAPITSFSSKLLLKGRRSKSKMMYVMYCSQSKLQSNKHNSNNSSGPNNNNRHNSKRKRSAQSPH